MMADGLTDLRTQILKKNKAAVEALIGKPVKIRYWKNMPWPPGATAAEIAAFKAKMLDEIWIYFNGRVHFNLAGDAAEVDDKPDLDLPPEQNPPLLV